MDEGQGYARDEPTNGWETREYGEDWEPGLWQKRQPPVSLEEKLLLVESI